MSIAAIIIVSIAAIGMSLAGLFALIRNHKNLENRWFFVFTILLSAWTVFNYVDSNFVGEIPKLMLKGDYILALFLLWSFYNFSKSLLTKDGNSKNLNSNIILLGISVSFIPIILLDKLFVATVSEGRFVVEYNTGVFVLYVITLVAMVTVVVGNLLVERHRRDGKEKEALNLILGGASVGIAANAMTSFLFPSIVNDSSLIRLLNTIGYIGLLIFALSIFWAITKKKLFDIRFVVARSVGYVLTIGVLAAMYGLTMFAITIFIFDVHIPVNVGISLALITALIGLSFPAFRQRFDKLTNHIFYQDAYTPRDLFDHVNNALVSSLELRVILTKVAVIISTEMKISHVSVATYQRGDGELRYYGEETQKSLGDLARSTAAIQHDIGRITIVADDVDAEASPALKNFLQANNIAIVSPLVFRSKANTKGDVLGYIMVGSKKSGNSFNDNDVKVINTLSNEIALAMQNALHYEEIQRFNETLQQRVNEATRKLKATNEKLKRMDETKDEFISMASHQLRTPLTSVKGYVSMVLDGDVGPINPQQRELLNQSFSSSQRMANLISDLLNLSRINTGKFVIEATPVYLPQIIEAELGQLREMAEGKSIELKLDLPVTFPKLMLDDNKMHQVIMNLIDNALYYTPEGGKVVVSLVETTNTVEFRVVDNGIGVPRDAQRHLFGKMYRADNARRARPDGTGLGLFMVKKVIVEQQGAVIFESEENKGSTFGFRFNKKDHEVPAEGAEESPVEQVSPLAS